MPTELTKTIYEALWDTNGKLAMCLSTKDCAALARAVVDALSGGEGEQ